MPRKRPPPEHLRRTFGALIKGRRIARGLTQVDLANACGVHPNTAMGWEQGKIHPPLEGWMRIAEACGMPLSAFLSPLDAVKLDPLPEDRKVHRGNSTKRAARTEAAEQRRRRKSEAVRGDGDRGDA